MAQSVRRKEGGFDGAHRRPLVYFGEIPPWGVAGVAGLAGLIFNKSGHFLSFASQEALASEPSGCLCMPLYI